MLSCLEGFCRSQRTKRTTLSKSRGSAPSPPGLPQRIRPSTPTLPVSTPSSMIPPGRSKNLSHRSAEGRRVSARSRRWHLARRLQRKCRPEIRLFIGRLCQAPLAWTLSPMSFPIPIISVVIGVAILLFGRKLFWLFVAAVGFALGIQIAPHLVHEPSPALALTFALVLGICRRADCTPASETRYRCGRISSRSTGSPSHWPAPFSSTTRTMMW